MCVVLTYHYIHKTQDAGLGRDRRRFWLLCYVTKVYIYIVNYPEEKKNRFSNNFILEAIKFILENNTFSFNSNVYKQTKGTAMGIKFMQH